MKVTRPRISASGSTERGPKRSHYVGIRCSRKVIAYSLISPRKVDHAVVVSAVCMAYAASISKMIEESQPLTAWRSDGTLSPGFSQMVLGHLNEGYVNLDRLQVFDLTTNLCLVRLPTYDVISKPMYVENLDG